MNLGELLNLKSHYRRLWAFGCSLPWPLDNLIIFLNVCGIRIPGKNAFMIFFQSVEEDSWYDGYKINRSKYPKTREVTVHHGGLVIEILSPT